MTTPKTYNCKNEELPVICTYALSSLQRDLADFTAYAPKFNAEYLAAFKAKTEAAAELTVMPVTETRELSLITARLYQTLESLAELLRRLEGYIKLAGAAVPLSVADFGISALRRKIHSKDAEGTLQNLRIVVNNIQKYESPLTAQGFSKDLKTQFDNALTAIAADNEQQYKIISGRRILVENNAASLNELYVLLQEICEIGKILYKKSQPGRVLDYTFTALKKKVRLEHKPAAK